MSETTSVRIEITIQSPDDAPVAVTASAPLPVPQGSSQGKPVGQVATDSAETSFDSAAVSSEASAQAIEGFFPSPPRIRADSFSRAGDQITFEIDGSVEEATLVTAVSVHRLDEIGGWVDASNGAPTLAGETVTVPLTAGLLSAEILRVYVAGTGPTPLVGRSISGSRPLALAGLTGEPTVSDGRDVAVFLGGI
ncbi:MAG: hypothetical protein ACTHJM_14760 [Marmoricola sp.]